MNHHDQHNLNDDLEGTLPADLRGVNELLDRAGADERAAAPRGLEDRLFASTRGAMARGAGAEAAEPDRGAVVARIGPTPWVLSTRFRMAAGLAIAALGVGAAAWLNTRSPVGVSGPAATISVAEISQQLEADLAAWETEHSSATDRSETQLAAIHESLDSLESDGTDDPWSEFDIASQEPSL
ncbi:MAG: hypothetical protein ACKVZJ_03185 [Phycisphaerales bacterium]